MNSIKFKKNTPYVVNEESECIAQIVAIAEDKGFRVYVAWEWEDAAKQGFFGIAKSDKLFPVVTKEAIAETAAYGWDISGTDEAKKIFHHSI